MDNNIIKDITREITFWFNSLDEWFNVNDALMQYKPSNNDWNIQQNLEHISLTNHYLLILIKKGTVRAVELSVKHNVVGFPQNYVIDWAKLEAGTHKSFAWVRPAHMEPTGDVSLYEIHSRLAFQKSECLLSLMKIQNGEGVLYKTMMSVNGLGKIDVYHYILFLVQHIKRHIKQMETIKLEFEQL